MRSVCVKIWAASCAQEQNDFFKDSRQCEENEVACDAYHCIDKSKVCDGITHCQNGKDEVNCPVAGL